MYFPGFDPWKIDLALYLYNFVLMSKKWLLSTLIYILSHYFYSYNFGRFVWAFVLEIFHSVWQHCWADAPRRNALFEENAATPKSRVNRMCSERAAMSMCMTFFLSYERELECCPRLHHRSRSHPLPCTREKGNSVVKQNYAELKLTF